MKIETDEQLQQVLDEIDTLWKLNEDGLATEQQKQDLDELFTAAETYEHEQKWFE